MANKKDTNQYWSGALSDIKHSAPSQLICVFIRPKTKIIVLFPASKAKTLDR
jgi:hypothetical protein